MRSNLRPTHGDDSCDAVCWLLTGWNRSAEFELKLEDWAEFGLSRFSASRGLATLERALRAVSVYARAESDGAGLRCPAVASSRSNSRQVGNLGLGGDRRRS